MILGKVLYEASDRTTVVGDRTSLISISECAENDTYSMGEVRSHVKARLNEALKLTSIMLLSSFA